MEDKKIDPQDLKNALDALWFAAAEIEAKADIGCNPNIHGETPWCESPPELFG